MPNARRLTLLPEKYLDLFLEQLPDTNWLASLADIPDAEITTDTFSFYTSIASVYSSKIEGDPIELDSYLRHKFLQGHYQPDYTRKVDDLFAAYQFARSKPLSLKNMVQAHAILTRHILTMASRGKIRTKPEVIIDKEGRIEYVAAAPHIVKTETNRLFADIDLLLSQELPPATTLYFAALIHLFFLKIHPFEDGNGRMARLLEKWFLAMKWGERAWNIPSERYYYEHLSDYYRNVHIGFEYDALNYDRSLPMLLMLPRALARK